MRFPPPASLRPSENLSLDAAENGRSRRLFIRHAERRGKTFENRTAKPTAGACRPSVLRLLIGYARFLNTEGAGLRLLLFADILLSPMSILPRLFSLDCSAPSAACAPVLQAAKKNLFFILTRRLFFGIITSLRKGLAICGIRAVILTDPLLLYTSFCALLFVFH